MKILTYLLVAIIGVIFLDQIQPESAWLPLVVAFVLLVIHDEAWRYHETHRTLKKKKDDDRRK